MDGFVGILYHDYGGIDHGADGNGNTSQGHNVRADTKDLHQ